MTYFNGKIIKNSLQQHCNKPVNSHDLIENHLLALPLKNKKWSVVNVPNYYNFDWKLLLMINKISDNEIN